MKPLFQRDRDVRPLPDSVPRVPRPTGKDLPPLTVRHSRRAATIARQKSADTHAALNLLRKLGL